MPGLMLDSNDVFVANEAAQEPAPYPHTVEANRNAWREYVTNQVESSYDAKER